MAQNPATANTHQTRSDEKLRKSHEPDWIGVQVSGLKIPSTQQSEIKEGVLWVLRFASSPETVCSTTYFSAKKTWGAICLVSTNFLENIRA
jgi:hypothetical protein